LFHKYGTIEHESYEESGTHLRGYMPCNHSGPFSPFRNEVTQSSHI
jgi:GTPase